MTVRQRLLKAFYPVLIRVGKLFGIKSAIIENQNRVTPNSPFYNLTITANDGRQIELKDFKEKNVLIVNTASDCGYTKQLGDLEKLQKAYPNDLVVIGFPSNDFKQQEKLSDDKISLFCKVNFGVTFLIARKTVVTKGAQQNEVFSWLSQKKQNGWNDKAPEWNFSKYLVNKKGVLTCYFGPGVEPGSEAFIQAAGL